MPIEFSDVSVSCFAMSSEIKQRRHQLAKAVVRKYFLESRLFQYHERVTGDPEPEGYTNYFNRCEVLKKILP